MLFFGVKNMIIKGKVLSINNGHIDISQLKVGEVVFNQLRRPVTVTNIEKVNITSKIVLSNNTDIELSHSQILGLFGPIKFDSDDNKIITAGFNKVIYHDTFTKVDNINEVGYKITLSNPNDYIFVSNLTVKELEE